MDRIFAPAGRCPFANECPSPGVAFVPGCGRLGGRQLTIAMEPGRDEADVKEPLVGPTGQAYRNAVGPSTVADEFRTNVRKCYHPHEERPGPRRASVDFCTARFLDKEVDAFEKAAPGRAATVVLMGEDATRYWLGLNDVPKRMEKFAGSHLSRAEADAIALVSAGGAPEVEEEADAPDPGE